MNNEYPILNTHTYLNTANHGLVSQALVDYRLSLMNKMRDQASMFTNNRNHFIDDVRETIAHFVDASPEFTAVIPNFSTGFNILINAIDRSKRFLLLHDDYPSLNRPAETRGFPCDYVTVNEHLEANIQAAFDFQTPDFFCFSMVQYISGIKIDLDFIKRLKAQYSQVIFIADGTQYIGSEEFRFRESGIDILLASCYKWLHAGDGHGFICATQQAADVVKPQTIGYRTTGNVMDTIPEFIARFEPGHQDMIAFGSLQFAMNEATKTGLHVIAQKIEKHANAARIAFIARNLLDAAVINRHIHSSIFNITGDNYLYQKLNDHKIITSLRGSGIRISFSHLNTQDDLQKLLKVIDL